MFPGWGWGGWGCDSLSATKKSESKTFALGKIIYAIFFGVKFVDYHMSAMLYTLLFVCLVLFFPIQFEFCTIGFD